MNKGKKRIYPIVAGKVLDAIEQYGMIAKGDRVLAAVSGGADSVCLFKVLAGIAAKKGFSLGAANFDHSYRGKESERDSLFVEDLARKYEVPFYGGKMEPEKISDGKRSLEEVFRTSRYSFLEYTAAENGFNVIATGHTMDDQAETVLIKVILGGSINGLSGIPPVRYEGRVRIVRPLIRVEREEILDLLDEQGQGYMTDSTNRDTDILRNSVRLEVIPFLIQYNPSLKRSLVNIADTLREDAEVLKAVGRKKSCLTPMDFKNGKVGIRLADILIQPAAVRKELCKKAFASAGGNVKKLTYRHWIKIDRFLRRSDPGSNLDLPGKITLEKKRAGILFRASETG